MLKVKEVDRDDNYYKNIKSMIDILSTCIRPDKLTCDRTDYNINRDELLIMYYKCKSLYDNRTNTETTESTVVQ